MLSSYSLAFQETSSNRKLYYRTLSGLVKIQPGYSDWPEKVEIQKTLKQLVRFAQKLRIMSEFVFIA